MTRTQLRHRDRLLARHETILDQCSDRSGKTFQREMASLTHEFESLAREADAARGDRLERARTWRYVGNAYFDLANGQSAEQLNHAAAAFQKSEALLQDIDAAIDNMKLDLCYGQALLHLFRLSEGKEPGFAEQARLRHASALAIAETKMPDQVESLKAALAQAEQAIALLHGAENLSGKITELERQIASSGSSPSFSAGSEAHDDLGLFGQLQNLYDQEVEDAKVSKTHKHALDDVLSQFGNSLSSKPDVNSGVNGPDFLVQEFNAKMSHSTNQSSHLRELMASMSHLTVDTEDDLPSGSRAESVWQRLSRLKLYLAKEGGRFHKGDVEGESLHALFVRCGHATTYLREHGNDDIGVRREETDVLRQLALEIRVFSLRNHLTLASPVWPSLPSPQHPNAVFFSGNDELRQKVANICKGQALRLLEAGTPNNFATMRWDQLRTCHLAIFDFTGYVSPDSGVTCHLGDTGPVAAIAYELGIALTLGRAVVVLAKAGQVLPFDVDIEAVRLKGDSHDLQLLEDAIDDAIYGLQRGGEESSIAATRTYLQQKLSEHENPITKVTLGLIDDTVTRDPIKFRRFVEPLIGSTGSGAAQQLIFPAWPGRYPPVKEKRLFHVTPFGPSWAKRTMKIAEQACKISAYSIQYIRGDQALDPDIIRSIWNSLCQASHILVDLTGLNANVALELGIAHVLGPESRILIVTQDSEVNKYFPGIAKTRMHFYCLSSEQGLNSLQKLLNRFLTVEN